MKRSTAIAAIVIAMILGIVFTQRRTLAISLKENQLDSKEMLNARGVKDKGPNIVVIGGGTGLNNVLKGLKNYTNNLTAIVTVSTYGSKIHKPTEDLQSSIIALAQNTEEMQQLMNYKSKIKDYIKVLEEL